jgi:hypothetical protein
VTVFFSGFFSGFLGALVDRSGAALAAGGTEAGALSAFAGVGFFFMRVPFGNCYCNCSTN